LKEGPAKVEEAKTGFRLKKRNQIVLVKRGKKQLFNQNLLLQRGKK